MVLKIVFHILIIHYWYIKMKLSFIYRPYSLGCYETIYEF